MTKVTKSFTENKKGKLHEVELIAEVDEQAEDVASYEDVQVRHYIDGKIVNDNLKSVLETMGVWESLIDSVDWRELYRSQLFEKEVA